MDRVVLSEYDQADVLLASYTARANGGSTGVQVRALSTLVGCAQELMCWRTECQVGEAGMGAARGRVSPRGIPGERDGRLSFVSLDCHWRTDSKCLKDIRSMYASSHGRISQSLGLTILGLITSLLQLHRRHAREQSRPRRQGIHV
jgi:hypothetical protein